MIQICIPQLHIETWRYGNILPAVDRFLSVKDRIHADPKQICANDMLSLRKGTTSANALQQPADPHSARPAEWSLRLGISARAIPLWA